MSEDRDPFDVRLAKVIDYAAHYLPDQHYLVQFHRVGREWQFVLKADQSHSSNVKVPTIFFAVEGKEFDTFPELLFLKLKDRVAAHVADAVSQIEQRRVDLEKARDELDKRLKADIAYQAVGASLGFKSSTPSGDESR